MNLTTPAAAALVLALWGCGPEYNWREQRSDAEHYQVMLPGKPAEMTRTINLDGLQVSMTMRGAQAGGASFVVGSVRLPDALPETQQRAVAAMRLAMVRNIAGTETAFKATTVPVLDAGGRAVAQAVASRIEASGSAKGKPMSLVGAFVASEDRAWQAVAVGERVDREQAATFVDSFRLLRP